MKLSAWAVREARWPPLTRQAIWCKGRVGGGGGGGGGGGDDDDYTVAPVALPTLTCKRGRWGAEATPAAVGKGAGWRRAGGGGRGGGRSRGIEESPKRSLGGRLAPVRAA